MKNSKNKFMLLQPRTLYSLTMGANFLSQMRLISVGSIMSVCVFLSTYCLGPLHFFFSTHVLLISS